jgi:hypothetical protein
MFLPQGTLCSLRQISRPNPHVASRGSRKILRSHLLAYPWKFAEDPIWIERLYVCAKYFGGSWIDLLSGFFSAIMPLVNTQPINFTKFR